MHAGRQASKQADPRMHTHARACALNNNNNNNNNNNDAYKVSKDPMCPQTRPPAHSDARVQRNVNEEECS
eukprot:2299394-Alexandrium_andersonii.AAC.1